MQTDTGERQFEVHKTQQFPGLDNPQEAPLPGDYQLQLASDSSSGLSTRDVALIAAAAVVAMLGLGAIVSIRRAKQDRPSRPPRANRAPERGLGGSARHGQPRGPDPRCDVRDAAGRRARPRPLPLPSSPWKSAVPRPSRRTPHDTDEHAGNHGHSRRRLAAANAHRSPDQARDGREADRRPPTSGVPARSGRSVP